ncbi:MAG: L,D-transpeptidase family protein [Actinomycetota bacterium]|nr:L,D-transpeptidase family protein [Actinomycetota bacterium]MDQ2957284.1 L,D-transpeptidase family protein [Actinomycetota bacterium]
MKRTIAALLALVTATVLWGGFAASADASGAVHNALPAGASLTGGGQFHSADGRYNLVLLHNGDLVIYAGKRALWSSLTHGTNPRLVTQTDGNLVLYASGRAIWATGTQGSGTANRLYMQNDGTAELRSSYGTVWSSAIGNGCKANPSGKRLFVVISQQRGRMCDGRQQILITPLTTGATADGDGTPTGTWRINNKVRNTYLYPAGGGVYAVRYWMPYSGNIYGIHDSSWQTFPYGSQQYKTAGSHGCVHLPAATMQWFFGWAPVGTVVTISN